MGGKAAPAPSHLPASGLILVSGPSRSGKSRWAEHLALNSGLAVTYLATGAQRPDDGPWQERLRLHRQRRPLDWSTLEVGGELEAALERFAIQTKNARSRTRAQDLDVPLIQPASESQAERRAISQGSIPTKTMAHGIPATFKPSSLVLIDSLGTWLAHHLDLGDSDWSLRENRLLTAMRELHEPVVLVCEEVGWGVVPATAIGGLFRDRCGSLHQRLMEQAAAAWLVVQGRALNLMALGEAVPPG